MGENKGKKFEARFREDWPKSFPKSFCYRLPDQISYYHNSSNPCDFICFANSTLFLLELKTHNGNTFPLANLTQYEKLLSYDCIDNCKVGVILWMIDHDCIVFIPISTIKQLKDEGKKSFNIKDIDKGYKLTIIPTGKRRTFLTADYTKLLED